MEVACNQLNKFSVYSGCAKLGFGVTSYFILSILVSIVLCEKILLYKKNCKERDFLAAPRLQRLWYSKSNQFSTFVLLCSKSINGVVQTVVTAIINESSVNAKKI